MSYCEDQSRLVPATGASRAFRSLGAAAMGCSLTLSGPIKDYFPRRYDTMKGFLIALAAIMATAVSAGAAIIPMAQDTAAAGHSL